MVIVNLNQTKIYLPAFYVCKRRQSLPEALVLVHFRSLFTHVPVIKRIILPSEDVLDIHKGLERPLGVLNVGDSVRQNRAIAPT